MQCKEISDLATLLRNDGDKILDASSKLSLSTTLLLKLNESFSNIIANDVFTSSFHVLNTSNHLLENFMDLQFLYDFVQKTLALKIFPDCNVFNDEFIDIQVFHNIKLLEVQRFSLKFVKGLKNLRSQLEYVTCKRSVTTLRDVLENCGADKAQGYIWCELKEAVFSYNNLQTVDASLEFAPLLQSLDLSHNYIQNIEPLNCLSNLKYLNLSNNKIESIPAFTGQLCNNLQVLILRNNFIEDIKELANFNNLHELDLCSNCLIDYNVLLPLTNFANLQWLCLEDNPLIFNTDYRIKTSRFLHINISNRRFILDKNCLSKKELRYVGSIQPTRSHFERTESFNSVTTANTVIPLDKLADIRNMAEIYQTSDMEVSTTSIEATEDTKQKSDECVKNNILQSTTHFHEQGMQDSGFVADVRPPSPSDSIDEQISLIRVCEIPKSSSRSNPRRCRSATSLQSDIRASDHTVNYTESDIEILSNPSQSSIEVLSSGQIPRCVQSCVVIPQTINEICKNSDLKKVSDEFHRSL